VKYHRAEDEKHYKPELDPKKGRKREWNWKKLLGSHENAHIAFTLSVQAVMGAFALLVLGNWFQVAPLVAFRQSDAWLPTLGFMVALMAFGLFKLNMHLGKPHRFYRGFYNLRLSPVSREIAGVSLFFAGLVGFAFFNLFRAGWAEVAQNLFAGIGLMGMAFGGYYMYKLYRIPARPFWDHWQTASSFLGTGLTLGSLLLVVTGLVLGGLDAAGSSLLAAVAALGLLLEGVGLVAHASAMSGAQSEGAASWYEQVTTHGNAYWLRNGLLLASLLLAGWLAFHGEPVWLFALLVPMALASSIIGRALFYVLVIPTTMPGAFFWRNRGFVEHAREVGLAEMPQLGVTYERHHPFRLDELWQTVRETSFRQKVDQLRRIFTG
jgi:DMSO reductase anchor subunit